MIERHVATAIIVLWTSKQFSTADIGDLLGVPESEVSRLVIAARSVARELVTPPPNSIHITRHAPPESA